MSRMMFYASAAFLLAVAPAAIAGQDAGTVPNSPPWQTKYRLPPERMIVLVGEPMRLVDAGDLPAGRAAFDRLLATARAEHGVGSVEVADLLESFGVLLYNAGYDADGRQMKEASLSYLAEAIPAYRAAFGNAHPEVALALNSYADVQLGLSPDAPPLSAENALEEAYGIRLNTLGPTNIETLATLHYLARVRGHPSRTRGDRARIEASARLFRLLVARSSDDRRLGPESGPRARLAFARMYARNGMAGEAREQLRLGIAQTSGWPALDRCLFAAEETAAIDRLLAPRTGRPARSLASEMVASDACYDADAAAGDPAEAD